MTRAAEKGVGGEVYATKLAEALLTTFPGRRSAFAERLGGAYLVHRDSARRDVPLTVDHVVQHVGGKTRIGQYLFDPAMAQTKVRCGVLDLDDHAGATEWPRMIDATNRVRDQLDCLGMKYGCFRSSGGAGVHIWVPFDAPVGAAQLRRFLRSVVEAVGMREGSDGGVAAGVVEIFPKQDRVRDGGYGNLVALPLADESMPLEVDGALLPRERFLEYLTTIEMNTHVTVESQEPPKRGRPRKSREFTQHPLEFCAFIQHCRDDAGSLAEPLWFAAATNCAAVEGGPELFHELSREDPTRYVDAETEAKLAHAGNAPGPHTCRTISHAGFHCPHLGEDGRCGVHGGTRPADFVDAPKARIQQIRMSDVVGLVRDSEIAKVVRSDLEANGDFFTLSDLNRLLYFHTPERELYDIRSNQFSAFCNERYDINASTPTWRYVIEDIKAHCMRNGQATTVYRFSVYKRSMLYIDVGGNQMVRLSGDKVEWIPNGSDGVLFEDSGMETIREDELSNAVSGLQGEKSEIKDLLVDPLPTDSPSQKVLFHAFLYSLFFESLLPTKPIALFNGQKGSGKTSAARGVKRALFGDSAEVSTGFTKSEKDATAAILNNYVLVADNVDGMYKWTQNLLASVSTGTEIVARALYTDNDVVRFRPRCFILITSRDPLSLKRDDIADRLLTFDLQRPSHFEAESDRLAALAGARPAIWAELLANLNRIVARLRDGELQPKSDHRLADWARLATLIGETVGLGDVSVALDDLAKDRHEFMLEGNALFEGIDRWVEAGRWETEHGEVREITTGELHREIEREYLSVDAGMQLPARYPIRCPRHFGKELQHNIDALQRHFQISIRKGRARTTYVQISPTQRELKTRAGHAGVPG